MVSVFSDHLLPREHLKKLKKQKNPIFVRENILIRICLDVINKCHCYTSYICILFGVSVFLFFGTSKLKTNHMKV